MENLSQIIKTFASDLWHRFRTIALTIDQVDRFVGMSPGGEFMEGESRWLQTLAENPDEIKEVALDMVLRAFRTALESPNHLIMAHLHEHSSASFQELMELSKLNRLSLSERINDLIQVGLVSKDLQTGQVQITAAGEALVTLIKQFQETLAETISGKLNKIS